MGEQRMFYGGQAIIEGVLMRGRYHQALAARRPNGSLAVKVEPVGLWSSSWLRRVPFVRGLIVLAETFVQGINALQWSANVALAEEGGELTRRQMMLTLAIALGVVAVVFFAAPAFVASSAEAVLPSVLVHLLEGVIRIGLLLAYLLLIGRMSDARRLFAYHGAEHKTIHAFEAGLPLEPRFIQPFSPAHPRCGTSFLLTVMVVSTVVFAFLGQPPIEWRVISRIVLLPVVAGISYELLRLGATGAGRRWMALLVEPGLLLQKLTTRQPDDQQVEVAVTAFNTLREAEAREGVLAQPIPHDAELNA